MATNTRNMLYYNGVWMDIVKLQRMTYTPQYSGMNYIHTRVDLRVRGLITSETNFEYIKLRYAAGSEAAPYSVTQGAYGGNVNKALLSDIRIVGDATPGDVVLVNSALASTPVNTLSAIRHHLLQPRGILLYFMNDDLVLGCPQWPYTAISTDGPLARSMDAKGGPLPTQVSVDQLTPNSVGIDFTITCYINEAAKYQNAFPYKFVESHSYYVDVDVDANGFETRTTSGVVNFRADALKVRDMVPDDFREFFAPILPRGFKREHFGVKISPDHSALQYRCVDREQHYTIDRFYGANSVWVGGPPGFGNGTIDRSKITRIQCVQTRSQNLKGGDAVISAFIGGGGMGAGGNVAQVGKGNGGVAVGPILANIFEIPANTENLSIKVFGNALASIYELERVAFYIMLVRLPYQVIGTLGYKWELRADKVGAYVELDVARTSSAIYGLPRPSIYQLNDDIKDTCGILNPIQQLGNAIDAAGNALGLGNLGILKPDVGYYPTNEITVNGVGIVGSFTGPEQTIHIMTSSASDSYRTNTGSDPFFQNNFDNNENRIKSLTSFSTFADLKRWSRIGDVAPAVTYLQELNPAYIYKPGMYFAHYQRSHGTAGTSAVVHTSALVDIANDIGNGANADTYAIKRVNTDYRYRIGNADNLNTFGASQLRATLDMNGFTQLYLQNPVVLAVNNNFEALPIAPYSYSYQAGA